MKHLRLFALAASSALALAFVVEACTLNPQPLPPDYPDGSTLGADSGAVGAFGDTDGASPLPNDNPDVDAGTNGGGGLNGDDAGDGGEDGATDAGDASTDAADDGG